MFFMDRHGRQCQFLEADLRTPLPRRLHFTSPDKIIELDERGGGLRDQESRLMLEQRISMGRGWCVLESDRGAVREAVHPPGSGPRINYLSLGS